MLRLCRLRMVTNPKGCVNQIHLESEMSVSVHEAKEHLCDIADFERKPPRGQGGALKLKSSSRQQTGATHKRC